MQRLFGIHSRTHGVCFFERPENFKENLNTSADEGGGNHTGARRLQGGAGGRPAVPVLWIGALCTGRGGFSRGQPLSPPIPVFADEFPMHTGCLCPGWFLNPLGGLAQV